MSPLVIGNSFNDYLGRCAPGWKPSSRRYDWAWVTISDTAPGCRYLLIRRNRRSRELAFYRCYNPRPVTLAILVKVAGPPSTGSGQPV